jgi:Ni,Fe-hydrogenase III small subunit
MAFPSDKSISYKADQPLTPGRPIISGPPVNQLALKAVCPTNAIGVNPTRIDLGRCVFCMACTDAFRKNISFIDDTHLSTNVRDRLVVIDGEDDLITIDRQIIRQELLDFAGDTIRLKVMTADDRFHGVDRGIQLVDNASDAHAIVINSAEAVYDLVRSEYDQLMAPKAVIVAGQQAITAVDHLIAIGAWYHHFKIDLYVPGEPVHPVVLVNGLLNLFFKNSKE